MTAWPETITMLAEGWSELIGVLVLFGFYAIGAIAKWAANRAEGEPDEEKSRAVELAKKYAQQRKAQQTHKARSDTGRRPQYDKQSQWDQLQAMKRRRLAQLREQADRLQETVKKPVAARPRPKPQPKQVRPHPEYARDAESRKLRPVRPPNPFGPQPTRMPAPEQPSVKTAPNKTPKPLVREKIPVHVEITKTRQPHPLDAYLKDPGQLRSAIVLKEILDKPVALREEW